MANESQGQPPGSSESPSSDNSLAGVAGGLSSGADDALAGLGSTALIGGAGLVARGLMRDHYGKYLNRMNTKDGGFVYHDELGGNEIGRSSGELLPNKETFQTIDNYRNGKIGLKHVETREVDEGSSGRFTIKEYQYSDGGLLQVWKPESGGPVETRLYMPGNKEYIEKGTTQTFSDGTKGYEETRYSNAPNFSGPADGKTSTFSNVITPADIEASRVSVNTDKSVVLPERSAASTDSDDD